MTGEERLVAATAIVRGLPGNMADQLTIMTLAVAMAMRLAAGGDEAKYARLVTKLIGLLGRAPKNVHLEEIH